ncbi:MAG: ATP-binding protein [Candidatus Cloacimonetes bacterium]|nr:ATP-binding protein [Candidatus Cloacimonadota bacterium]
MNYIERELESQIVSRMDSSKALFILGARQVGKTTLLKRLMEQVGAERSLYYDLEIPANLELFSGTFESVVTRLRFDRREDKGKTYVFLDEIQYLSDFSKTVKILVDHYAEEFKFVMTGSSSLLIKHQFSESLAGRKEIVVLHPLSFAEFCRFKGEAKIADQLGTDLDGGNHPLLTMPARMEELAEEYTIFGGFPGVVIQSGQKRKIELLNDIVTSYILKDIKHILRIEKLQELNRLIRTLALSIGKEINISELSRNVGLHRESVQKYLLTLEESFIVSTIRPFYSRLDKELRKMPKVYLQDTGIRNMLVNDFSALNGRRDRGELVENVFFLGLLKNQELTTRIRYWKTKQGNEVDFVVTEGDSITAYEVKYGSDRSNHFSSFLNAYPHARCFTVRHKYKYKQAELPLWYRIT